MDTADGRTKLVAEGRWSEEQAERHRTRGAHSKGGKPSHAPAYAVGRFVAWDTEGVTIAGRHRTVIIANSEGDYLKDARGIKTGRAFRFLLDCKAKYPKAVHVIYAGDYDVNMLLKGQLIRKQARTLAELGKLSFQVDGTRYRISHRPNHRFTIAEIDDGAAKYKSLRTFTWQDVFGSFQSSFVVACRKLLEPSELAEIDFIEEMKAKRGEFRLEDLPEMLAYCQAELRALVLLVQRDTENFIAAGFVPQRYDGAGAKASAVLQQMKVKVHKQAPPDYLLRPVLTAYAGGRSESLRLGHYRGPLYTVDLRSAYPWAATFLPSLAGGHWEEATEGPKSADEFSVWHAQWAMSDLRYLHPLFCRNDEGLISFPSGCEGWYWAPEIWAARKYGKNGKVTVLSGYRFIPANDERPFSFIPGLYHRRRALENAHKGRGIALKLALNSLYGKLAQTLGGSAESPPPFFQIEWAGWITSKVRAEMFRLGYERQGALISIQTDGLTFLGAPDDNLLKREGTELGDLEIGRYVEGVFMGAGLYWLKDSKGWLEGKRRGVKAGGLERQRIARFYDTFDFADNTRERPRYPIEQIHFRTYNYASVTDERWKEHGEWLTDAKSIGYMPERGSKRDHWAAVCRRDCELRDVGLHTTWPIGYGTSTCYRLAWDASIPLALGSAEDEFRDEGIVSEWE